MAFVQDYYLLIKALHLISVIAWMAGLFYLPRLFVYHAMAEDAPSQARFKIMERKLYYGIMTPGAVLTIGFGLWLMIGYGFQGGWLHAKLTLVLLLVAVLPVAVSGTSAILVAKKAVAEAAASNRDAALEGRYDPLNPNRRFMKKGRSWQK
jgi:uncharacterized integral membrane protein (TIGR00701 family)